MTSHNFFVINGLLYNIYRRSYRKLSPNMYRKDYKSVEKEINNFTSSLISASLEFQTCY